MSVRLISGEFGGRTIATPESFKTHPMGDRVRMSLFNILGPMNGLDVLDAFAGSGALGFEALSRGAERIAFVERDRSAQLIIDQNIAELKVQDRTKLIRASVGGWLDTGGNDNTYDIIFADPPYNNLQLSTVFRLKDLLNPKGLMILSYPGRELTPTVNGVVVVDKRSYGNAALAFYRLDV